MGVPASARVALPRRAYDTQVQGSLTLTAALAYVTLDHLPRPLPRPAPDRLRHDSQDVRAGYTVQLVGSFYLLTCFLADVAYVHKVFCKF
ncbi:hypothetical protein ABZP36_003031 [Zizania latifolia]